MNSPQPSTSTTDAFLRRIPAGGTALTAGVILSAHAVLHVSPLTSTILAVALVRREGVVATLGALFGVLTAVYSIIYIPIKREAPSAFTTALASITNAMGLPVVADTKTAEYSQPEQASAAESAARTAAQVQPAAEQGFRLASRTAARYSEPAVDLSPLPSARSAARIEAEPVLWQLVHEQPVKGRHARVQTSVTTETAVTVDAEHAERTSGGADPEKEQLARAA